MLHHEYEIVFILRPDLDEATVVACIEDYEALINDNDGSVLLRDDWGQRKLAYPIKRHLKGHYVLVTFLAPATLVAELERRIRINDKVLRFLTVKVADQVDVAARERQAAEERRVRADEAKARAEAEARAAEEAEAARLAAEEHLKNNEPEATL